MKLHLYVLQLFNVILNFFFGLYNTYLYIFEQALYGVYAKEVHVRMACLNAVKCIPAVSSRCLPQNVEVATSIWISLYDPEKV